MPAIVVPVTPFSGDKTFVFAQNVPSATWTVVHNLSKHPAVSVVDSAGSVVHGDIQYVDDNSLVISFASAFSGRAFCN